MKCKEEKWKRRVAFSRDPLLHTREWETIPRTGQGKDKLSPRREGAKEEEGEEAERFGTTKEREVRRTFGGPSTCVYLPRKGLP